MTQKGFENYRIGAEHNDAGPEEPGPAFPMEPGETKRLAWHVGEGVGVRAGAAALTLVERGDLFHVAGIELEVEELEVLPHSRWRDRLREHDVATLDVPP